MLYYILEWCWNQYPEDALGAFLSAISPDVLIGREPVDIAIYYEWREHTGSVSDFACAEDFIKAAYDFMTFYENQYGFPLTHTRELLQNIPNKEEMFINAREYSQSLDPPATLSSED